MLRQLALLLFSFYGLLFLLFILVMLAPAIDDLRTHRLGSKKRSASTPKNLQTGTKKPLGTGTHPETKAVCKSISLHGRISPPEVIQVIRQVRPLMNSCTSPGESGKDTDGNSPGQSLPENAVSENKVIFLRNYGLWRRRK